MFIQFIIVALVTMNICNLNGMYIKGIQARMRTVGNSNNVVFFSVYQPTYGTVPSSPSGVGDKWVPVTWNGASSGLRVQERPPIWRVATNMLNKQSRTADTGWSSSLGVGQGANNSSP